MPVRAIDLREIGQNVSTADPPLSLRIVESNGRTRARATR
jgi:hypothetical protein